MSSSKYIDRICILITVCAIALTLLFMNGEAFGIQVIADEDAEGYTGTEYFTANDLDGTWDDTGATVITLDGDSAQIKGNGAYTYDGSVTITNAGYYVVSGTLTDGSLIVDAYNSSKVWIRLAGTDITCSDDAAIRINQADKVFLTLAEGTENTVRSGETYSESALSDNTGGAVFSHDDLTINGTGSLTVTAAYKHGIDVNDSLMITGGDIRVTAVQDGLHANDAVRLSSMTLNVSAGDDGIRCDKEIVVASGTVLIGECVEGLEAAEITVEDGDITIYPTDDGFNATGGTGTEEGYEGTPFIVINGGNILIENATGRDADGLDSNGDIYINGGSVRISLTGDGINNAIDYASEAGGVCVITGGDVIACGSSSMTEHFDAQSTQCAVLYNFTETAAGGSAFALKDADGNVLLQWEVPQAFSSVNVSCPALETGGTYRIAIGENEEEITVSETAATYGDAQGMRFGGNRNQWGGMQRGGRRGAFSGMTESMTEGETPPSLPAGMAEGETPPALPEGMAEGETPPEPPAGMAEGEAPPDMAAGGTETAAPRVTIEANGTSSDTAATTVSGSAMAELAVCVAVLLAGIAAAAFYRRRKH